MMLGMKHSLCFTSMVSKAQPSESMPTRKSCFFSMVNMRWSGRTERLLAVGLRNVFGQFLRRVDRLELRHPITAIHDRHREHVFTNQWPGITHEVIRDIAATGRDPFSRESALAVGYFGQGHLIVPHAVVWPWIA